MDTYKVIQTVQSILMELFKIVIAPSFFAILVVHITKKIEKKNEIGIRFFDKKNAAFTLILSQIKRIINTIKAGYSWENDKFLLLSESQCDDFEEIIMNEILYLPERVKYVLEFIVKLLRNNSDWRYNIITPPDEDIGFIYGDLKLIEYFYGTLVSELKMIINDKKKDFSDKDFNDIKFLKLCYLLKDNYSFIKTDAAFSLENYNYEDNSIIEVLNNFHKEREKIIIQLKNVLKNHLSKTEIKKYQKDIVRKLLEIASSL